MVREERGYEKREGTRDLLLCDTNLSFLQVCHSFIHHNRHCGWRNANKHTKKENIFISILSYHKSIESA